MCLTPSTPRKNELQRAQDPHTWPLRTNTGVRQSQNSRALGSRYDAQVDGQGCRDGAPALLETRTLESDPPSRQVPIRSNRTRSCSKRVVAEEWMSSLWTRGQSLSLVQFQSHEDLIDISFLQPARHLSGFFKPGFSIQRQGWAVSLENAQPNPA